MKYRKLSDARGSIPYRDTWHPTWFRRLNWGCLLTLAALVAFWAVVGLLTGTLL